MNTKRFFATTLACGILLSTGVLATYSHQDVLVTELDSNVVSASAVHEGYISITRNLGEWGTSSVYVNGNFTTTPEDYESVFGHPMDYSQFTEVVYEEYVTDDFRYGFIDIYGNELFPFSSEYSYGDFSEGLAPVLETTEELRYNGLINPNLRGYVNTAGEIVIPIKYYAAGDFVNGYASVSYWDDAGVRQDEIIDKTGKTVLSGYEIESYQATEPCIISKDGKYGLANYDGTILVEPVYDRISQYTIGTFVNGLAEVTLGDKSGYVNTKGELVFDVIYDDTWFFSEDKIWVGQDGKYAIINSNGEQVTDYIYEKFLTLSANVLHMEELEAIGDTGTAFASLGYTFVYLDENANEVYRSTYNNRYSGNEIYSVDASGTVTYYPIVDGAYKKPPTTTQSGLYRSYEEYISEDYHEENPQKYGFTDADYNIVIPTIYTKTDLYPPNDDFSEGYAVVTYNGNFCIIRNPLTTTAPTATTTPTVVATPTTSPTASTVLVDGVDTSFEAYNIAGNNYFKLRDIAQILSGTEAQFEVTWDGDKQAINLVSGEGYTCVGGELATGDGTAKAYAASTSTIYLNGEEVSLTAYTINDNNYFKLRDLGEALGFNVSWDSDAQAIVIASDEVYTTD